MIRCIDVCKVYQQGDNQITALAGVSLEIPQGAFAAVMGQSGSGKSTLLHLIGGLDRPSNGELLVDDRLIGQMSDDHVTLFRRSKIGFIFQFFNLLPTLSAAENVALPFVLDGRSKSEADQRAAALLAKVGLQHRQQHLPEELSGGEIQRVAIARALAFNPPILLADEPTGNLDSETAADLGRLFDELVAQGKTLIIVTHDPNLAQAAHRIVSLRDGGIASDRAAA
ncbi:MAG TPA: ABC transporter ATP-binding protein [Candidatus Binatia bacterium]|nr:ABC transporter ATP-binding protein [Candidatus Binatia bacterium]